MDEAKFTDKCSLSTDSAFNIAGGGGWLERTLFVWLAKTWAKWWPTVSKLKMLDLPWFNVEGGIQRLRETGVLEWIFHLRPTHPH